MLTVGHAEILSGYRKLILYMYIIESSNPLTRRLRGQVNNNGQLLSPWIDWYRDFSYLTASNSSTDTLFVMDSCSSAMAGIGAVGEVLVAAGWEGTTPASPSSSFTKILIDEINAFAGCSFTASQLYQNLMSNAVRNNMAATPIHKANLDIPSVLVHKIGTREAQSLIRQPQRNPVKVLITVALAGSKIPNKDDWVK
jgi:hypothetical protein